MQNEKTLGERRVRTDFNVDGSTAIDEIKQKSAECIDLVNSVSPDSLRTRVKQCGWLLLLPQTTNRRQCGRSSI